MYYLQQRGSETHLTQTIDCGGSGVASTRQLEIDVKTVRLAMRTEKFPIQLINEEGFGEIQTPQKSPQVEHLPNTKEVTPYTKG